MGLGKTVQALTLILSRAQDGPDLCDHLPAGGAGHHRGEGRRVASPEAGDLAEQLLEGTGAGGRISAEDLLRLLQEAG